MEGGFKMSEKMKAGVLYDVYDLRVEEIDKPEVQDEEVMIKVKANGICGSDVHFYKEGELGPFVVNEPYVPGHECSGEIVDLGRKVKGIERGDRVVVEPGIPCRKCEFCKEGKYNLCPEVVFLSAPPIDGTFSEYVSIPYDFVYKIPSSMTYWEGALVEPAAVGVHACNRAGVTAGNSVAVLGVGPIGLLTLQAAKSFGATQILVVDILDQRLNMAGELGAHSTINATEEDVTQRILEAIEGKGIDIVFETAGSIQTSQLAVKVAKRGGTVVHVGWANSKKFEYNIAEVMEKELDIIGINRYANAFSTTINLINDGKIKVKPLITHDFKLENIDFLSLN